MSSLCVIVAQSEARLGRSIIGKAPNCLAPSRKFRSSVPRSHSHQTAGLPHSSRAVSWLAPNDSLDVTIGFSEGPDRAKTPKTIGSGYPPEDVMNRRIQNVYF
jgi:hypothetical protein